MANNSAFARVLFLLFLALSCHTTLVKALMTAADRQYILSEHNRLRRSIKTTDMIELTYDMDLECVAQNYLNYLDRTLPNNGKNPYPHNPQRSEVYATCRGLPTTNAPYVGENWWSKAPQPTQTLPGAVVAWTDAKSNFLGGCSEREIYATMYNDLKVGAAPNPACRSQNMVGHFTQIMWNTTQRVGCGYSTTWGTVCNYFPGGNWENVFATYGTSCSQCPTGFKLCDAGLCSASPPVPGCPRPVASGVDGGSCAEITSPGSKCTPKCASGYAGTPPTLTCTTSNSWSPLPSPNWCTATGAPVCYQPIINGYDTSSCSSSGSPLGATCQIACPAGSTGTPTTMTCQAGGMWTWSGSMPQCVRIQPGCRKPSGLGLSIVGTCPDTTPLNGRCSVQCGGGLTLSGSSTLTCVLRNGQYVWSSAPVCVGTCPTLTTTRTGVNTTACTTRLSNAANRNCSVTCQRGFAGAARTFSCAVNSTTLRASFNGTFPSCAATVCTPPTVTGASFSCGGLTRIPVGRQCTLRCNSGYVARTNTITCVQSSVGARATWRGLPGACVQLGPGVVTTAQPAVAIPSDVISGQPAIALDPLTPGDVGEPAFPPALSDPSVSGSEAVAGSNLALLPVPSNGDLVPLESGGDLGTVVPLLSPIPIGQQHSV